MLVRPTVTIRLLFFQRFKANSTAASFGSQDERLLHCGLVWFHFIYLSSSGLLGISPVDREPSMLPLTSRPLHVLFFNY